MVFGGKSVLGVALALGVVASLLGLTMRQRAGGGPGDGYTLGPGGAAFYQPPARLTAGAPGSLIWARPIVAPPGARAWRILYRSTDHAGHVQPVSGLLIAPDGPAPAGGRPVLAWAHGTTGGPRQCAPSLATNPARNLVNYFTYGSSFGIDIGIPALTTFLKAGYAVVATDYQGLGGPGIHQYAVGRTEAHNVLDSVKAAERVGPAAAGRRAVVLGWSQGGGAALFVGQGAGYGAPLKVLGVAALAPASDFGPEFTGKTPPGPTTVTSPGHDAALRINLYRGLLAAYPELRAAQVLTPAGLQALHGDETQCIEHLADVIEANVPNPATLFQPGLPPANWQNRLNENTPGNAPSSAPVLVMQGTADTVINPNATAQYVQAACRFGRPVHYSTYAGATHQTIPYVAQSEYVRWIAARFASTQASSTCSNGH